MDFDDSLLFAIHSGKRSDSPNFVSPLYNSPTNEGSVRN